MEVTLPKILIVLITKDTIEQRTLESIWNQDYPNYSWIISGMKPKFDDPHPVVKLYKNCSYNREYARKMALASDAQGFVFLDSDVVMPTDALASFVLQAEYSHDRKHIIGSWCPIRKDGRWAGGKWIADNVFMNLTCPEPSLIKVDMTGMGCTYFSREVLQKIHFTHGTDKYYFDPNGQARFVGECLEYCNLANDLGYNIYMDGNIICEHLER
jgi:hypothetical protein